MDWVDAVWQRPITQQMPSSHTVPEMFYGIDSPNSLGSSADQSVRRQPESLQETGRILPMTPDSVMVRAAHRLSGREYDFYPMDLWEVRPLPPHRLLSVCWPRGRP